MDLIALFGTLRHSPLRTVVLGRAAETAAANLPGYEVRTAPDGDWPVLVEGEGAPVDVIEASAEDLLKLDHYEAVFGYTRRRATLDDGRRVWLYAPAHPRPAIAEAAMWSLSAWAATHAPLTIAAAGDIMALLGTDPAEVAGRRSSIFGRAQARLNAREEGRAQPRDDVTVANRRRDHDHFYALDSMDIDHPTFAGGRTGPLDRSVLIGFDVVLVLPWDPVRRRVLLVEQFRIAPFVRGEADPWCLEPVAGIVDPFETAESSARRETEEEAGLAPQALHPMAAGYPSAGSTTEYQSAFLAICDLPDGAGDGVGGVEDEGEDIARHVLGEDEAIERAASGGFRHVPLTMMLLWLAHRREGLRAQL